MASSRVVLSGRGAAIVGGSVVALLLGLLTLNLLLLLLPTAVLALAAGELLLFDRATRGFGPERFRWQRLENSAEVPLDTAGSMAIDLGFDGAGPVYAEVFDPQPESFEVVAGSPRLLSWWSPDAPIRLAYAYRPRERGRFRIGPTIVVAHDPLGFAFRMAKLENRWEVLVTPALSVEEAVAGWAATRPSPTDLTRRRVGTGSEFRSLREYLPTDDARRIAWRRSGLEKVYVREHEEEVHADLLIVVDAGWEMRLGPPGGEAFEQAIAGATVLAGRSLAGADRVGLLVYSDRVEEFVPLRRGFEGARELTQALARAAICPRPFDFEGALHAAVERLSKPTPVVLLSTLRIRPTGTSIDVAVGDLRARGHRLVVVGPDPARLFPPPPEDLAERAVAYVRAPLRADIDRTAARLRACGVPVTLYPAPDLRGAADAILESVPLELGVS